MKKIRILIAGGTGFIGYHLAKRCLKLKWKVVSISTKPPKKNRKLENVNYLILDISNQKKLFKKLSSNYDYVVNLAGYVDHSHNVKTMKSHFNGCKNLSLFFPRWVGIIPDFIKSNFVFQCVHTLPKTFMFICY